jgi:anti-sigma regulatory factor (Ser/Thr protein kinase)
MIAQQDANRREAERLEALRAYQILDTDPEVAFDDLALLASHICATPMAAITLVDEHRQWFKARVGLPVHQTARSISFCTHAIEQRGIFVIRDASKDERLRDNPQVIGDPHIRFYAGAPLITRDGHALGTLCVVDRRPRQLTQSQLEALSVLRRQVEAQLELRRRLIELRAAYASIQKMAGLMPYCSTCEFTMTIPADPAAIPAVIEGVNAMLTQKRWPEEQIMAIELALQEAIANGIRHGCGGDATKQVQCIVNITAEGEAIITVRDPGQGFDPSRVANPLAPENMLKPSGRGIFLINGLMDDVRYGDGGRELKMKKRKMAT